jgi:hypothetical protein
VILVFVESALSGDVQFIMQRGAQSGKMWFPDGAILPNETYAGGASRVLFCETGLPLSSDDVHVVRYEKVSITLSDEMKHHISVFETYAPSNLIASHLLF